VTNINPAKITLARESRGWTQGQLAHAIHTKQSTVSKYEAGAIPVTRSHLESISTALRYEAAFFLEDATPVALGGDFLYRSRAGVSARTCRRVEAEANIRMMQVVRLLRSGQVPEPLPFPAISPAEVNGQVDRVAQEMRKALRIPPGPIRNLTRILENAGVIVFAMDFGTDQIDGTNIRRPGLPPLLFLNQNVSGERHRWNLAHELAHVVMHFGTALNDPEEEADAFAREFLMPKAEIRNDLKNLDLVSALRLKPVWGVSMAAIIKRAESLRIISTSTVGRMFRAMNARDERTVEPIPLPFEKPELFDRLLELHRNKLGFSKDDMQSLLYTDKMGEIPVPEAPMLRLADEQLLFDA